MSDRFPLDQALRAERDGAAVRRRAREIKEDSWLYHFPGLLEEYCFCLLRIDDHEDEAQAQKAAKALDERYRAGQSAWEAVLAAWPGFSPYEVLYQRKYPTERLISPRCIDGSWEGVRSARQDFAEFKEEEVGMCQEHFEAMLRSSDFITGLALALGKNIS